MSRLWTILLFCAVSCSGYRFSQSSNPLSQYGVDSLAIPMFYNFSSQPEVAPAFTRETYRLLSGFSGLRLHSGWSEKADAVMVGIIRSPETVAGTQTPLNPQVAQAKAPNNVGSQRPRFPVPGATRVAMVLQVVVIKRPSSEEMQLLRSDLGPKIVPNAKLIFNETFNLSTSFNREIFDEEAGRVVATQNAGALRRAREGLALQAAQQIRDMILYAF